MYEVFSMLLKIKKPAASWLLLIVVNDSTSTELLSNVFEGIF